VVLSWNEHLIDCLKGIHFDVASIHLLSVYSFLLHCFYFSGGLKVDLLCRFEGLDIFYVLFVLAIDLTKL
jgi:hypothetical protein